MSRLHYNNIYYLSLVVGVVGLVWLGLRLGSTGADPRSLIGPTPIPKPSPTPRPVRLLFVGDIMLDRHIRQRAQTNGSYDFILDGLKKFMTSFDLVIGNLEGPITTFNSISINSRPGGPKNYTFTFEPKTAYFLASYNIKTVSLGNNHILNFGLKGLSQTTSFLSQAGVEFFGQPDQVDNFIIKTIKGYRVALINYNQFLKSDPDITLKQINQVKNKADFIIIYTHWGQEYKLKADPSVVRLAHAFIDAGADLVIGSHPHVIQNQETYQGKRIYYSLGNFIFDQYFQPEVKKGLAVEVRINPKTNQVDYKDYYVELKTSGQTVLTDQ